jgi:hypothetical protein
MQGFMPVLQCVVSAKYKILPPPEHRRRGADAQHHRADHQVIDAGIR